MIPEQDVHPVRKGALELCRDFHEAVGAAGIVHRVELMDQFLKDQMPLRTRGEVGELDDAAEVGHVPVHVAGDQKFPFGAELDQEAGLEAVGGVAVAAALTSRSAWSTALFV